VDSRGLEEEMKKIVLALAAVIALVLPVAAQNTAWDAKFRAIPNAKNIGDYIKRMSARPHHLGLPVRQGQRGVDPVEVQGMGWDCPD
jgi:hypothetical protein